MEPTMLYYDPEKSGVNMTIGKDAGYYHPDQPNVIWNQDRQPYGYAGVTRLFETLLEV
jgi:nitrogenase molybdenum-cofactor synthesis protein NifE